ncbi:MAG TPA: ABC transporter permease [Anaerohalosphaeraceae bacterium]|nr:ABC transporter permease [Anaerohalosphaeraceae bacterium]
MKKVLNKTIEILLKLINPVRLIGPVFDKEMRVSSRRKRTYVLRSLYLLLLLLFVVLIWMEEIDRTSYANPIYQVSRMSEAGLIISTLIVWFQFVAAQIVLGISLSTSISDEIYSRTLGVMMTTPITSAQIVLGKLFSKFLIVLQLVLISVPMLAIVRIFGGIPWMYILSSLYLTITTALVVGSIGLLWSIFCRRAYVSIIATILTVAAIFGLSALFFIILVEIFDLVKTLGEPFLFNFFYATNPYATYILNTIQYIEPGGIGRQFVHHWVLNGVVMLCLAGVLLCLAFILVRRAALAQIAGDRAAQSEAKQRRNRPLREIPLRTVSDNPVLWKECSAPLLGRRKKWMFGLILAGLALVLFSYILLAYMSFKPLKDEETHMFYLCVFLGLGMLFTLIIPATTISSEKESNSWMILLASPLTARQIVWSKYIGSIRRCLPAWMFLFLHLVVFVSKGMIHPVALLQISKLSIGMIAFLTGTGIYFSHRFRHTTTAVIWNISFAAVIWLLIPFISIFFFNIIRSNGHDDLAVLYMNTNPFVQGVIVIEAAIQRDWELEPLRYFWINSALPSNVWAANLWMFFTMLGYVIIGWAFVWWTCRRLRKRIL